MLQVVPVGDGTVRTDGLAGARHTNVSAALVRMPVMDVGKVRVRVSDRRMLMRMRVRLLTIPIKIMRMLVVLVVPVSMVVVQNFMSMGMFMPLTDMQPDSNSHECSR